MTDNRYEIIMEELSYINDRAQLADGFEDALIGIDMVNDVAVYDYDMCIEILMKTDNMTREDALDYFDYNVLGTHVGKYTPTFVKIYK